jgi:hypothetical protein
MLEGPAEESAELITPLEDVASGTLVLWEILDRIVMPGFTTQDFLDLADRVERHLAMVFHRYLSTRRVRISINGRAIEPWDPFLTAHQVTYSSPIESVAGERGVVLIQGHVLPHRQRLTASEHRAAGGPDGWTAQQGFYVYRNERLLVTGHWLGLGQSRSWTKEQAHQLARLRIDISNTADAEWKIDIRKSTARPPIYLKHRLVRLAEDIRERARRVFGHRAQPVRIGSEPTLQAWRAEHFGGSVRYRINEEHPAVKAVLEEPGDLGPQIRAMLRIIEETIPVQRIWLDAGDSATSHRQPFAGESHEAVNAVMTVVFRNLIQRKGLSPAAAKAQLRRTEPFFSYPELIAGLPDDGA